MASITSPRDDSGQYINQIETAWSQLRRAHERGTNDVERQVAQQAILNRYQDAVMGYLRCKLRSEEAAEDVWQDFAVRFLRGSFRNADPEKGRFRDLLKTSLRNLISDYCNRQKRQMRQLSLDTSEPTVETSDTLDSDREFLAVWRKDLLNRAWAALVVEEQRTDRPLHTVLSFRAEHLELRSGEMAELLSSQLGKTVSAGWVRKWLHAARQRFAEFLIADVTASLREPTLEMLLEELIDLELYQYCKAVLDQRHGSGEPEVSL